MIKAIALIDGHPTLTHMVGEMEAAINTIDERIAFLRKQHEKINEECEKRAEDFHKKVEQYCRARGLLPTDYDPKHGHHLHVSKDAGTVAVCDCDRESRVSLGKAIQIIFDK